MACEFLEVIHLADAVNLSDDPVQDSFDFLVGTFAKKGSLAFQAALMAKKLFPIEVRDAFTL
jgi:hypothetical protein